MPVQYSPRLPPASAACQITAENRTEQVQNTRHGNTGRHASRAVLYTSTGNVRARVEKRSQSGGDRPDDHRLQVHGRQRPGDVSGMAQPLHSYVCRGVCRPTEPAKYLKREQSSEPLHAPPEGVLPGSGLPALTRGGSAEVVRGGSLPTPLPACDCENHADLFRSLPVQNATRK